MSTSEEQIKELASTTSHNEQLILLKKYSQNGRYSHMFEVVVKALEMNHIDTAKKMACFYLFWWDLNRSDLSAVVTKAQATFSWPSFVDFFVFQRWVSSRTVDKLAKALIAKNLIRLSEFVRRPIHTFYAMLNSFEEPEQLSETIYKIMTEKGLTRSDRLNMLKLMRESNKLTLEPCGPQKLSPPFYCLLLGKLYLLRHFQNLPGIANYRGPKGENFLTFAFINNHIYKKHIRLFSKDELKVMLVEKHDDCYVLDLIGKFHGYHLTTDFVMAVKELLIEGKLRDSNEVNTASIFHPTWGGKFLYHYGGVTGTDAKLQTSIEHYSEQKAGFDCVGNTSFDFEELPLEIFQLICEELDSHSMIALVSASKSLQKFTTKFDIRYYERTMKKEFPLIYGSLKADQSQTSVNWKHQLGVHSRRAFGWRTCKDPAPIRVTHKFGCSIIGLDENWLLANSCGTLLWNTKDQKTYHKSHPYVGFHRGCAILHSSELEFPTLIGLSLSKTHVVNYNNSGNIVCDLNKQWESWYVAPMSKSRVIVGDVPEIYDVEANKTVVRCTQISHAERASHNKSTQLTAISFTETTPEVQKYCIAVLDKNFGATHMVKVEKTYFGDITWIDEYSIAIESYETFRIADIRMPQGYVHETNTAIVNNYKPINITRIEHMPYKAGRFTSNYVLDVKVEKKLACVWSMKDLTWSNVIVLPDDVKDGGRVFCNSRYAAIEITNNILVLDFMSNK